MMWKIFLKTFFIDTFLNDKNMQNYGFAYIMSSALKKISKNTKNYYNRLYSHFEYFNSNPFFLPGIIGICVNLEKKHKDDIIYKIKLESMAPLSALADSLVFGTLKPLLTIVFVSLALFYVKISFVLFFLAFFILTNLFRIYTLYYGYKLGLGFILKLTKLDLQGYIAILKRFSILYLGGFVIIYLHFKLNFFIDTSKTVFNLFLFVYFLINSFFLSKLKNLYSFFVFLLIFIIYYFIKF